ncbi:MAG: asparaginase [Beijerinckiaceae bacterium]
MSGFAKLPGIAPSMVSLPKIALVSTGGTIGSLAADPLEILDYGAAGSLDAAGLVQRCSALGQLARIVPVSYSTVPSFDLHWPHWLDLLALCTKLAAAHADLDGIVVTHGTGSLEETAYVFSLLCPLELPVVFVGAQRPPSAAGSDSWMNLAQAIRVAADPSARGLGALVVMNGEIHAARDVRKTSNLAVDTFRSPEFGPIGVVEGLEPRIGRRPCHRAGPSSAFAGRIGAAPEARVDILYCHAGGDAVAVKAFIAAGARAIVIAGFPPGFATSEQSDVLAAWCRDGGIVVHASRADGPTVVTRRNSQAGFLPSRGLSPVKARLLLSVALACGIGRDGLDDYLRSH